MNARRIIGTAAAAAASLALMIHLSTWLGYSLFPAHFWALMAGTMAVALSGVASAYYLKPHYKVDRVLQIPRLRPYFSDAEYKSLWAAFWLVFVLVFTGIAVATLGRRTQEGVLTTFSAGWFGFLYIDAMILLRAKLPALPSAAGEA